MSQEKNWLFHIKTVNLFLNMENGDYGSQLNRKLRQKNQDITLSHLLKIVSHFKKNRLITTVQKGRLVIYTLTPKGEEVQDRLKQIMEVFNNERKKI